MPQISNSNDMKIVAKVECPYCRTQRELMRFQIGAYYKISDVFQNILLVCRKCGKEFKPIDAENIVFLK